MLNLLFAEFVFQVKVIDLERMVDMPTDGPTPRSSADVHSQLAAERERELSVMRERDLGLASEPEPLFQADDPGTDEDDDEAPVRVVMSGSRAATGVRDDDYQGGFMDILHEAIHEGTQDIGAGGADGAEVHEQGTGGAGEIPDVQGTGAGAAEPHIAPQDSQGGWSQAYGHGLDDPELDDMITRLDSELQAQRSVRARVSAPHPTPYTETESWESQGIPFAGPSVDPRPVTASTSYRPASQTAFPGVPTLRASTPPYRAVAQHTPGIAPPRAPPVSAVQPTVPLYQYVPPRYPFRTAGYSAGRSASRPSSLGAFTQPASAWEVHSQPGELHGDGLRYTAPDRRRAGRPPGPGAGRGAARGRRGGRRGRPPSSGRGRGRMSPADVTGMACLGADEEPEYGDGEDSSDSSETQPFPEGRGHRYILRDTAASSQAPTDP